MQWPFAQAKIITRSILTPGLILTAIVTPLCLWLSSKEGPLQVYYFIAGCVPPLITFGAFVLFLFKDPSKLLTEETQVQHLLTSTFGQSAQTGREAAAIIDAIRRDPRLGSETENPYHGAMYYDQGDTK